MSSGRFGHRSWALNIWSRPKTAGTVVSLLIGLPSGHLAGAHEVGGSILFGIVVVHINRG